MDEERREFMKTVGRGAALLGAWPLVTACGGAVRSESRDDGFTPAVGTPGAPPVGDMLFYASLAPSSHNSQPWRVRLTGPDRFAIGFDRERLLAAVDPGNREMFLAMGAFLENLIIAAGTYGYGVDYQSITGAAGGADLLAVTLQRDTTREYPLELLRTRRTLRTGHLPRELAAADIAALASLSGGRSHYFSPSSAEGRYLREAVVEATRLQTCRDAAQQELADWIRWSDCAARRYRTGLTPATMELKGIVGWYARHFMTRASVLEQGFRQRTVEMAREQAGCCGGWLAVTSVDASPGALFETGRGFERMLLEARRRMIAIHPMSQALEEPSYRAHLATALGLAEPVQFILRASPVASYPAPVSLRRPVAWFVGS